MTAGDATEQPNKRTRPTWTFPRTLARVFRYTAVRIVAILAAVIIAVFLTIFIANLGGYVDDIVRSRIDETIAGMVQGGWLRGVPAEEKAEIIDRTIDAWRAAEGLNEPFLVRCFRWLGKGLLLDWGNAKSASAFMPGKFSTDVADVILLSLPRTLFIFGAANLLLFFVSIALALALTRRIGSRLDRTFVAMSPMSAAPAWVVGIILNMIIFGLLGFTRSRGLVDAWPPEFKWEYVPASAQAVDPSVPGHLYQRGVSERLRVAHLLYDPCRRGLCGDGPGQGPASQDGGAALYPSLRPACGSHRSGPVDGRALARGHRVGAVFRCGWHGAAVLVRLGLL